MTYTGAQLSESTTLLLKQPNFSKKPQAKTLKFYSYGSHNLDIYLYSLKLSQYRNSKHKNTSMTLLQLISSENNSINYSDFSNAFNILKILFKISIYFNIEVPLIR